MSIFLDIIKAGRTTVTATASGSQIYEPFATQIEIDTVNTVNIATGDLKIIDSFEVFGTAYIPSGYTNFPFIPVINDSNPFGSQAFNRSWLNSDGTETAFPTSLSTGNKGFFRFNPLNSGQLNRYIQTEKFILYTGNSLIPFLVTHGKDFQGNITGIVTPFSFARGPQFIQGRVENYEIEERFEHVETSGTFCLLPDQKMGFGTFTPKEKMDIQGNLRIDGGYINPITGDNVVFNITGILV